MRFSLYAGDTFLMSAPNKDKLVETPNSMLRRWLEEMGIRGVALNEEVELRLYDNGELYATRRYIPSLGRLHGWKWLR